MTKKAVNYQIDPANSHPFVKWALISGQQFWTTAMPRDAMPHQHEAA